MLQIRGKRETVTSSRRVSSFITMIGVLLYVDNYIRAQPYPGVFRAAQPAQEQSAACDGVEHLEQEHDALWEVVWQFGQPHAGLCADTQFGQPQSLS